FIPSPVTRPLAHRCLHSFPTRRSSDLEVAPRQRRWRRQSWWCGTSDRACEPWPQSEPGVAEHQPRRRTRAHWSPRPPLGYPLLRSEEHTCELQSRENLVSRLLLEKKNY